MDDLLKGNRVKIKIFWIFSRIYLSHFHSSCRSPGSGQADKCLWLVDPIQGCCCNYWISPGWCCLWCYSELRYSILHGWFLLPDLHYHQLHGSTYEEVQLLISFFFYFEHSFSQNFFFVVYFPDALKLQMHLPILRKHLRPLTKSPPKISPMTMNLSQWCRRLFTQHHLHPPSSPRAFPKARRTSIRRSISVSLFSEIQLVTRAIDASFWERRNTIRHWHSLI